MLSALDITGFLCTCKPLGTNHPLLELYNDQVALPIYSGSYYKTGTTYICIITIISFYQKNFGHYLVSLCSGEQDKNTRLFPKMLLHSSRTTFIEKLYYTDPRYPALLSAWDLLQYFHSSWHHQS